MLSYISSLLQLILSFVLFYVKFILSHVLTLSKSQNEYVAPKTPVQFKTVTSKAASADTSTAASAGTSTTASAGTSTAASAGTSTKSPAIRTRTRKTTIQAYNFRPRSRKH